MGTAPDSFQHGCDDVRAPSLTNAQETEFDIPARGTINVPLLQSFSSLSVLNLPWRCDVQRAEPDNHLRLRHHACRRGIVQHRSLSQIDSTQLAVNRRCSRSTTSSRRVPRSSCRHLYPLSVDGVGSKIDLHTLQTLTYGAGNGGALRLCRDGDVERRGDRPVGSDDDRAAWGPDGAHHVVPDGFGRDVNLNALTSIKSDQR